MRCGPAEFSVESHDFTLRRSVQRSRWECVNGVWDPEDLFSWYDENGNMMGDVDTFGPGWTYEKCGTRMNYRDHASQGLTQLPYRLSVGSVCYLNGVAYTYSGYFEVGYYPTNSSSEYRLVIETCTPNDENGNHKNYICYFN